MNVTKLIPYYILLKMFTLCFRFYNLLKQSIMEELIQRLQNIHGLSPEQSHGILNTITGYIKEKFPMVGGAIDNIFPAGTTASTSGVTPADVNTAGTSGSMLDKISDFIPGSAGEKIEEFAKDKFSGLFGGNKTV
jgi:hypothetical protein